MLGKNVNTIKIMLKRNLNWLKLKSLKLKLIQIN